MDYDPCPHVVDACDSCALKQAEAWIEHLEAALGNIAEVTYGDLCGQLGYWAKWALEGKDINGQPVPGLPRGIEEPDPGLVSTSAKEKE